MATGDLLATLTPTKQVPTDPSVVKSARRDYVYDNLGYGHEVLDFPASETTVAVFDNVVLGEAHGLATCYAGGGLTATFQGSMDAPNTSKAVRLGMRFESLANAGVLTTNGAATAVEATITVADAVDTLLAGTIAFTDGAQIDSLSDNGPMRVVIYRDHDHAGDTAEGTYQLSHVLIKET